VCRVFIADVEEGTPTKTSVVTEHVQAMINDTRHFISCNFISFSLTTIQCRTIQSTSKCYCHLHISDSEYRKRKE